MSLFTQNIIHSLKKLLKVIAFTFGFSAIIMLLLCFTSLPFWAHYHLGIAGSTNATDPEAIVILGGSGMPSQDGLIRTYYGAEAAHQYPLSKVIIALPGDSLDPKSSLRLMAKELILRGIDSSRILFENEGTNTRWEALNVKNRFFPNSSPSLLLVSSPSHIYRSVKTFEKAGFDKVGALASFSKANESSLVFDADQLGGSQAMPDMGSNLSFRYLIWTRLHLQITVLREYMAISYYWLMGWI